MFDFSEQVVLVTGGATGIGRATCEAFARDREHAVVADVEPVALFACLCSPQSSFVTGHALLADGGYVAR